MNALVYLLFLSVFLLDYLSLELGLINRKLTWIPEFISLFVTLLLLARLADRRKKHIQTKYVVLIVVLIIHYFVGMVLNTVPEGVVITGLRTYLKYLPFFLLPAFYSFSHEQIRRYLFLLAGLALLQVPLAVYQRLVLFKGVLSGDPISGTVNISSMLSILMVSAIAIVVGMYVKERITKTMMILLVSSLVIPTTINETKSSLIFVPLAFMTPILLARQGRDKYKKLFLMAVLGAVAMVAFVQVYDHFMKPRWGHGLSEFLAEEGQVETYLYKGVEAKDDFKNIGKVDSWILPIQVLSEDPIKLLFGLGIGNVSDSFLKGLSGEYFATYAHLGVGTTSLALLLWETGLVGVIIHVMLIFMIFKDSLRLSGQPGFIGGLAAGWVAVTIIVGLSLPYKAFYVTFNVMGFLFWFISGLIVAELYRLPSKVGVKDDDSNQAGMNEVHRTGHLKYPILRSKKR